MEINNSIGSTSVNIVSAPVTPSVSSSANTSARHSNANASISSDLGGAKNHNVKANSKPNETTSLTEISRGDSAKKNNSVASEEDNGYNPKVEAFVKEINEKFSSNFVNTSFNYQLHEATNRFIVQVKNSDTGDVLREIPSEKSLDFTAKMLEMAGLLVDEKS